MNKYKLNVLKFLTQGKIPDRILKESYDFEVDNSELKFKAKFSAKNAKNWRGIELKCK